MGFEPQTADQPLVNVHKRTTQVNFAVVIGVVVFLLVGIGGMIWFVQRSETDTPPSPPVETQK